MIDHALASGLQVGKRHDLVHETAQSLERWAVPIRREAEEDWGR
jgi:hypothetical protein